MNQDKALDDFMIIWNEFFENLLVAVPEMKNRLEKALNWGEQKPEKARKYFQESAMKYVDILAKKQVEALIKHKEEILFAPGVDFRRIFRAVEDENSRDIIWKYLQTLHLTACAVKPELLQKALENIDIKEYLLNQNLNTSNSIDVKQLTEQAKAIFGVDKENVLGELMGDIASDVVSNLNNLSLDEQNLGQLFESMMGNVSKKIENKIKNGELNPDDLKKNTESLLQNLGNNEAFANIINAQNSEMVGPMLQEMQSLLNNNNNQEIQTKKRKSKKRNRRRKK